MKSFSLYLHIPYCLHKCPYCDFNTYALTSIPEREYVSALLSELDYRASLEEWRGRTVQTIYFGGGTPSLLSPAAIRKIISAIGSLFPIRDDVEVSLEANPGSLGADQLASLSEAGVNRLSLGAQSFERDILKTLGRMHTPEQIEAAVTAAKAVGFRNVSLDLIYGVPNQTMEQVEADLQAVIKLAPQHVSAYGLTIEKGTPFYVSYRKGTLLLPPEETLVNMMEAINSFLPVCGYKRYEISNFSERGKEARHNLAYWNGDDYLGLGAGAHSCRTSYTEGRKVSAQRWSNYALPNKYMSEAVAHGKAEGWRDTLAPEDLMFEFFFLGLRKAGGVRLSDFEGFFGAPVQEYYGAMLEILGDQDLLSREGDFLAISEKGLLLADSVIENFAKSERKVVAFPTPGRFIEKDPPLPRAAND